MLEVTISKAEMVDMNSVGRLRLTSLINKSVNRLLCGEVVAQLVECSPINLLACASMGSNPVTATLGKTLNSQCLPWAEEFH